MKNIATIIILTLIFLLGMTIVSAETVDELRTRTSPLSGKSAANFSTGKKYPSQSQSLLVAESMAGNFKVDLDSGGRLHFLLKIVGETKNCNIKLLPKKPDKHEFYISCSK